MAKTLLAPFTPRKDSGCFQQGLDLYPQQFEKFVTRELAHITDRLVQEHRLVVHEMRAIDLHKIAALRTEIRELRQRGDSCEDPEVFKDEACRSKPHSDEPCGDETWLSVVDFPPVPKECSRSLPRTPPQTRGSMASKLEVRPDLKTPRRTPCGTLGLAPPSHVEYSCQSGDSRAEQDMGSGHPAPVMENGHAGQLDLRDLIKTTSGSETKHSASFLPKKFLLWPCWSASGSLLHLTEEQDRAAQQSHQISWTTVFAGVDDYYSLDIEPDHSAAYGNSTCVLRPSNKGKVAWDLIGVLVMMWDVLMIPLQVFELPKTGALNILAFITTSYWAFDIVLTFFVGYYSRKGLLITERTKIARRYVKTWFALDVLIVSIDVFLVIQVQSGDNPLETTGIVRFGKAFKILRLIRIIRLFRLRKIRSLFATIQDIVDSERMDITVGILRNMGGVMMVNHFLACIWWWIGSSDVEGWDSWPEVYRMTDQPWEWCYLTSFHWSITQFTPASMNVQPQNVPERVYALGVIVLAMVMFSSFVSSVTNGMNRLWSLRSKQNQELWMFRKYLRQHEISRSLTVRLNRYIQVVLETQQRQLSGKDIRILSLLSEPLHLELQTELFLKHLIVHPLFNHMQVMTPNIIRMLCADVIKQQSLSKGDKIFYAGERAHSMYFLIRGVMLYQPPQAGSVPVPFHCRQWCSEAPLWTSWKHMGVMRAKFECEMLTLEASKFQDKVTQHHLKLSTIVSYGAMFVSVLNQILHGETSGNTNLSDIQMDLLGSDGMHLLVAGLLKGSKADRLVAETPASCATMHPPRLVRVPHIWTRSYP